MTDAASTQEKAWRPRSISALAIVVLFFAILMGAGGVLTPPPVRSSNAADQFNAPAAQERLARILGDGAPHPVDSTAADVTRAALLREIEALGFRPEVRESFICRPQPRSPLVDCAFVRNIVFSVGPAVGPAILAATHYDSVPAAPGASDAGIGMAAWLEVARLMAREPLQRRIIFLISDGEEPGLLGAHAFAHDPLMADVQSLVNLEARGTRGPAIFFESNQPNGDAVAAYANAPRPIANSVMADVYALLSNSTDVTALRRPGLDVINIALLDGLEDYHTPQDSLGSFNTASLQHMGDMALATTRALASSPNADRATPQVYTDIASRAFISVPSWTAQTLLAVAALLSFAAFWRTGRNGRWRAFGAPLLGVVLAATLVFAIGFLMGLARPGQDYWFAHAEPMRAVCILATLLAMIAAPTLLRISSATQLGAAAGFWFTALGLALSFALNGASILFVLPAVVYAVGAVVSFIWPRALATGGACAALVAALVWAPTINLIELALGYEMPFAIALLMSIVALTWLGAIFAALGVKRRFTIAGLGAALAVALATTAVAPASSESRPRALNLNYFLDATSGEGYVLAGWSARALPVTLAHAGFAFTPRSVLPGDIYETWAAPTDAVPAPTPSLESVTVSADGRSIRATLRMNGVYRAIVRMPRTSAPNSVSIRGVETSFADTGGDPESDFVNAACQGRACDGAQIIITLSEPLTAPQDWFIIGQTPGFTTEASRRAITQRGGAATPIQFGDGAVTLQRLAITPATR